MTESTLQPAISYDTPPNATQSFIPPPKKPAPYALYIAGFLGLLLFLVAIAYLMQKAAQNNTADVVPTPSPTMAFKPAPVLSKIATTAAFMEFDQSVASLSAIVNLFSLDETTLTAPQFDLELGLTE